MSLADEIKTLGVNRCQSCLWLATLPDRDRKALDAHIEKGRDEGRRGWMADLFRLCRKHGLEEADVMMFRHHLRSHDAS